MKGIIFIKYLNLKSTLLALATTSVFEIFGFIKVEGIPSTQLLIWLGIALILDLITGVSKAVVNNVQRTSKGFRETIKKFIQYGGAFIVAVVLSSIAKENSVIDTTPYISFLGNAMVVYMIYIEVISILENLVEVDKDSEISRLIIKPLHKLLTFQITKNKIN